MQTQATRKEVLQAVICGARNAGDRMRGLSGDTGIELKIQNSSLKVFQ